MREERARTRLREVEHRPLVRENALQVQRTLLRLVDEADTVRQRAKPFQKRSIELLRKQRMVWQSVAFTTRQVGAFLIKGQSRIFFPTDFRQIRHKLLPLFGSIISKFGPLLTSQFDLRNYLLFRNFFGSFCNSGQKSRLKPS